MSNIDPITESMLAVKTKKALDDLTIYPMYRTMDWRIVERDEKNPGLYSWLAGFIHGRHVRAVFQRKYVTGGRVEWRDEPIVREE